MTCPKCNAEVGIDHAFCPFCGNALAVTPHPASVSAAFSNTSGLGEGAEIPAEIKGWSWPGFLWNWIWAIGNNVWIGLLCLVPYIGFIMVILLGVKGREWAWHHKHWNSIEEFNQTQHSWVKWWLIIFGVSIGGSLLILFLTQLFFGVNSSTFKVANP